ncbi:MAG: LacI family DNA-binding transcriptional regulator [Eubacteriales bacterium]|nr:LacI family DNA-binding transcriptional regulator [Eubacteriales bacterium]
MGKVRMADIAKHVGVSTVTVHNALSGQKGVSDEVRSRILQAADEMGYLQRPAASLKAKGKGLKNIGVIISEKYLAEYTTFYWKMYQEMALIATDKNCAVLVEILKHSSEDHSIMPRIVEEHKAEGLIVLGEISREYIRSMKERIDIPVVFLDFYDKELANDAVITDNFYGMYLMTEYLFEKGFRNMAYVGSIHATSSIMDRYCGFYKALLEHGVELRPEWLIEDRDQIGQMTILLPERLPEAFVCNCDLAAGTLIMQLEERGIKVPEDISVVGFDNYLYPGFPDKKITSYEVNTRAMVKVALDKVLKQIRNSDRGHGLDIVSGHIVEKQSVRQHGSIQ